MNSRAIRRMLRGLVMAAAMTSPRNILLIALLFISYLLWMQWQEDYHRVPGPAATTAVPASATATTPVPAGSEPKADVPTPTTTATPTVPNVVPATPTDTQAPVAHVVVTTDVLRVEIDPIAVSYTHLTLPTILRV